MQDTSVGNCRTAVFEGRFFGVALRGFCRTRERVKCDLELTRKRRSSLKVSDIEQAGPACQLQVCRPTASYLATSTVALTKRVSAPIRAMRIMR